jgi:hypothetical protein
MLPTRLERQIAFFNENPGTSVICSFSYIIDAKGKRIGKSQNDVDASAGIAEQDPSRFLEVVYPSVIMVKEDVLALGGYNEALTRVVDRDLWGRFVTSGKQILCQREFLTDYRLHGSSLTMSSLLSTEASGARLKSCCAAAFQTSILPSLSGSTTGYGTWSRVRMWPALSRTTSSVSISTSWFSISS